jgi:hypothetical protein
MAWSHVCTLYTSCNIVVALMAHLQLFLKVVVTCNYNAIFEKNQTWLIIYVCTMCINYCIEDPFSIHLQL